MFHRATKVVRPKDIMTRSLMLLDNFMGKMHCCAIFGKYIAMGDPQ